MTGELRISLLRPDGAIYGDADGAPLRSIPFPFGRVDVEAVELCYVNVDAPRHFDTIELVDRNGRYPIARVEWPTPGLAIVVVGAEVEREPLDVDEHATLTIPAVAGAGLVASLLVRMRAPVSS